MGFFNSIKNAFHHPVDVNIVSDLRFDYQATQIPLTIELINKDKANDLTVTTISVAIERYEQQDNSVPTSASSSQKDVVSRVEQQITVQVPITGQPTYVEIIVPNSVSQVLGEAAQETMPDNAAVQGLLAFAGKLEQASIVINMGKTYYYQINVDVLDTSGTVIGFDHKQAYFLRPGESTISTAINT